MENWAQVTHIWEGLENFRQLRRDIFHFGLPQLNQAALDQFFPSYNFTIGASSKSHLLNLINQTLEGADFEDPSIKEGLLAEKEELEKVQEELVLKRSLMHFNYEFVFKESNNALSGFIKIFNKSNRKHVGLMNWQDGNDPMLYLFELENNHLRMHINFGKEGLAIIEQDSDLSYRWTHCLQEGYLDILHAETGSITMSKMTKNIKLEQGNLATVEAAKYAKQIQKNGKTALENNIELLKLYKPELEKILNPIT